MDSADGEHGEGQLLAARKGGTMKRLEKAIAECDKARERMEASKARYEEDVKKLRAAEAAVTEAENLEYVRIIREMHLSIPEFELLKEQLKAGNVNALLPESEEHESNEEPDEENMPEENGAEDAYGRD